MIQSRRPKPYSRKVKAEDKRRKPQPHKYAFFAEEIPVIAPTGVQGPRKSPMDWEAIATMVEHHSTQKEIAGVLRCDPSTLKRRVLEDLGYTWAEFVEEHASQGKMNLRKAQFHKAIVENDTRMQMWLGKNILDQTDKMQTTADVKIGNADRDLSRLSLEQLRHLEEIQATLTEEAPAALGPAPSDDLFEIPAEIDAIDAE